MPLWPAASIWFDPNKIILIGDEVANLLQAFLGTCPTLAQGLSNISTSERLISSRSKP